MISDVIAFLGEIPGLEKTAVRWAEARYNAKVAIAAARAFHRFIESEGFHRCAVCDSRCWLERRPASDDPTSFH